MLRRTREVGGPGVSGCALIAKMPSAKPPEYRILARRMEEEGRRVFEDKKVEESRIRQRNRFESLTDARIKENAISQKTHQFVQEADAALEARRQKLAQMLEIEEASYIEEVQASVETPIERLARMRERVRSLKSKRENERKTQALELTERHWVANCEPLRTAVKGTAHLQIDEDRHGQMREKKEQRQQEKEIDTMYAECWEADKLAKDEREEYEAWYRQEINKSVRDTQIGQVQENVMREQARLREVQDEKAYREQQAIVMKQEDEAEEVAKVAKKHRLRRILDKDAGAREVLEKSQQKSTVEDELKIHEQIDKDRLDVAEQYRLGKLARCNDHKDFLNYTANQKMAQYQMEQDADTAILAEGERRTKAQLQKRRAIIAQRQENTAACAQSHIDMMSFRSLQEQTARAMVITEKRQSDMEVAATQRLEEEEAFEKKQRYKKAQYELLDQMEEQEEAREVERQRKIEDEAKLMEMRKEDLDKTAMTITGIHQGTIQLSTLRR